MNKYGLKCPECGSVQIWKSGYVPTREGRKDRFKCTVCAHSFYKEPPVVEVVEKPKRKKKAVVEAGGVNTFEQYS